MCGLKFKYLGIFQGIFSQHSVLQIILMLFAARQLFFSTKQQNSGHLVKKFKSIAWQPQKQGEFCEKLWLKQHSHQGRIRRVKWLFFNEKTFFINQIAMAYYAAEYALCERIFKNIPWNFFGFGNISSQEIFLQHKNIEIQFNRNIGDSVYVP